LVLFGQACGELVKRNRNLVSHLLPPKRARIALSGRDMIRKKKETRYFATMRLIFKLVGEAKFTEIRTPAVEKSGDQWLSTGSLMWAGVSCLVYRITEGVKPDERRARLYRAVESLGDAIRTDDLETAERYREQLSVFYTTTGEALGDAVAELYKVTGWWLYNFRDRMDYKQQALRSGELIIGLIDA
jgi:hypothetical protein